MITLEQRIARIEKALVKEAKSSTDPDIKKAKAAWRNVHKLDREAVKKCEALIKALRKAADKLESRTSYDGSDEGWDIHGTDNNNLKDFVDNISTSIAGKASDASSAITAAQNKFDELDNFMTSNGIEYDELDNISQTNI